MIMNVTKATNLVCHPDDIEPMAINAVSTKPKAAPAAKLHTRSSIPLLLGIALLAAWFAINTLNQINELNVQIEQTRLNLLLPSR